MKRLWDEEPPFKRTSSILGVNDDDQVKLWRRHAKWNERVKDKAFSRWVTFYDDGSLTSDRFLIKLMLVSLPNKFKAFKALKEQAEDCEVRVQYEVSRSSSMRDIVELVKYQLKLLHPRILSLFEKPRQN